MGKCILTTSPSKQHNDIMYDYTGGGIHTFSVKKYQKVKFLSDVGS